MTLLRRHRLAKGLSQTKLARLIGRSCSAVSSWEAGGSTPDAELYPKLAKILGIDPLELTRVIDPPAANQPAAKVA